MKSFSDLFDYCFYHLRRFLLLSVEERTVYPKLLSIVFRKVCKQFRRVLFYFAACLAAIGCQLFADFVKLLLTYDDDNLN